MKLEQENKTKMSMKYFMLTLLVSLVFCANIQAQNITIQGTITSEEDNTPIPGASVIVKGTSNGAVSDFDGNYTISAKTGDVLVFSYIGMNTKSVTVAENTTINVALEESLEELDEVVVVGYGTVKKKELTGAVAQVKAEDIEGFVTPDVASALQGQIAGVNIVSGSGEPGEEASIQIRGITSLTGSNEPLYVVDGIPQAGNPGLSINEIETFDVLKDAASTAVYGTRGAGGVILITTKQGKEGVMRVSLTHTYGVQHLGDGVPLMNTEEQLFFATTKFNTITSQGGTAFLPGPRNRPEWLNNDNDFREIVVVEDAPTQSYNLNISGGTSGFSYNVVGGFLDIDGSLLNSGFKRYNGRASTSYKNDKWNIDTSIAYTIEDRDRANNGLLTSAIRYNPWFPIIDRDSDVFVTDGTGGVNTPLNNLAQSLKNNVTTKRDRINVSLRIRRELSKNLSFTTRIGTNVTNDRRHAFRSRFELFNEADETTEVDPTKSGVEDRSSRSTYFSWDGSFTYKKKIGDHNITALASVSTEEGAIFWF